VRNYLADAIIDAHDQWSRSMAEIVEPRDPLCSRQDAEAAGTVSAASMSRRPVGWGARSILPGSVRTSRSLKCHA